MKCKTCKLTLMEHKKGRPKRTDPKSSPSAPVQTPTPPSAPVQTPTPPKRGRKKKEPDNVQVKKKRGRKLAVDYYSTSACKREMSKPSSSISNTILQLNVEPTETTDYSFQPVHEEDYLKYHLDQEFKKLQDSKNTDILETYLESGKKGTLEDLYKSRLESRVEQESDFIKKLENFYTTDTPLPPTAATIVQEPPVQLVPTQLIPTQLKQKLIEQAGSTLIKDLDKPVSVKILKNLINVEWPEYTTIKCWWCCYNFDTIPIGMPIKYHKKDDKYHVRGIFCSIGCMYAHCIDTAIMKKQTTYPMIKDFYNRLTNKPITSKIKPAPPRETLVDFGGEWTIDRFRTESVNSRIYKRIEYPMMIKEDMVHSSDIDNMKKIHIRKNASKSDNLDVKVIEKPLQKTTIDSFLNIEYEDEF